MTILLRRLSNFSNLNGKEMNIESIVGEPTGSALRQAINRKIASPSLRNLEDSERVRQFAKSNLRASYLFARFVVPSYAAAIFSSLTRLPPIDNSLGPLIISLLDMVKGELSNNNIFDRPGECHAHYHDAKEAYISANDGDDSEISEFEKQASNQFASEFGIKNAILHSPFWSPRSQQYAIALMECCQNPYGAVLLMAANEEMAPETYKIALKSLSNDTKFDPLRNFMTKHVSLDGDAHGPAALQWLEIYKNVMKPRQEAENLVLKIFNI